MERSRESARGHREKASEVERESARERARETYTGIAHVISDLRLNRA
jgi:hypothetical protein